jgi:hypothetical protein
MVGVLWILLAGCALVPNQRESDVMEKAKRVQEQIPAWVNAGGDPNQIAALVRKVEGYVKAGNVQEASRTLDEALAILATPPKASSDSKTKGRAISLEGVHIGAATSAAVRKIPDWGAIVYHADGYLHVIQEDGSRAERITLDRPKQWEHVAASHDWKYVVANAQPNSTLWLFDLTNGVMRQLAPNLAMAGEGGVAVDPAGYVYFAGKSTSGGLPDVYKIKLDGSGLTQLTNTPGTGELDVSVSQDGLLTTYVKAFPDTHTEIWVGGPDGTGHRMVYRGGAGGVASAHDPELSPDRSRVVFSVFNTQVAPNYPQNPAANTAHDLWVINLDGTGLKRLTKPGPISMIPNWRGDHIVYTEVSERDKYAGASLVSASGQEQTPHRIKRGANAPKWLPK